MGGYSVAVLNLNLEQSPPHHHPNLPNLLCPPHCTSPLDLPTVKASMLLELSQSVSFAAGSLTSSGCVAFDGHYCLLRLADFVSDFIGLTHYKD